MDAAPWGARGMFVSDATVAHVCAERPEIERGQGVLLAAFRGNLRRHSL